MHTLLQLLLSIVVLTALVAKVRDYARFREVVARYEILPRALTGLACMVVLTWEATTAVTLWVSPPAGAALAASLFAVYATAITVNLLRGRTHIDCGCESGGGRGCTAANVGLTAWLPLRNAVLILLALMLASPVSQRPLAWADYALIAAAAPFFAGAFLIVDRTIRQWLVLRPTLAAPGGAADA